MASSWGAIFAALIAAVVPSIGLYVEYMKRKASEQRETETANRANELERQRLDIERERNSLARENEFNRRMEAAQLKALSDEPKQRRAGLIDLGALRDEAPSPERARFVQAHIDGITKAVLGQVMVDGMDFLSQFVAKMPYLQPPLEPPSPSPEGQRIWEIARQTAESSEELKSLILKENERQRETGQGLIDGDDLHPPGR